MHPAHRPLLDRLRRLGVLDPAVPAQVWGPRDGMAWRVVDLHGRETVPLIYSRTRLAACLSADGLVPVPEDGAVRIDPVRS